MALDLSEQLGKASVLESNCAPYEQDWQPRDLPQRDFPAKQALPIPLAPNLGLSLVCDRFFHSRFEFGDLPSKFEFGASFF